MSDGTLNVFFGETMHECGQVWYNSPHEGSIGFTLHLGTVLQGGASCRRGAMEPSRRNVFYISLISFVKGVRWLGVLKRFQIMRYSAC